MTPAGGLVGLLFAPSVLGDVPRHFPRHNHDPVAVRHDDVARIDRDTADGDGNVLFKVTDAGLIHRLGDKLAPDGDLLQDHFVRVAHAAAVHEKADGSPLLALEGVVGADEPHVDAGDVKADKVAGLNVLHPWVVAD